jgi:plasmid maintenance system antidote protein VapI
LLTVFYGSSVQPAAAVNRTMGIVNENRAISATTALQLSRYFGNSAKM